MNGQCDDKSCTLADRYSHGVSSPSRHVRTRLYFTSESHIHSLLTVLRFGGLIDVCSSVLFAFVSWVFTCHAFEPIYNDTEVLVTIVTVRTRDKHFHGLEVQGILLPLILDI